MPALTDHPDVRAALAGGAELTDQEQTLLVILLDPDNDPRAHADTVSDMLEKLESFTGHDLGEAVAVSEILNIHHDRRTGRTGEFIFELTCNSEHEINGYNVLSAVGTSGSWMATSGDEKYLLGARYELRGLRAALKIAETLDDDYVRIPRPGITAALNRAAADVTHLHPQGQLVRDSVNLVVNAALHYLEHPGDDLTAAIESSYDDDVDDVINCISDPDD